MVVWGEGNPAYMRIRGLIGDYDFCSAMVYGVQENNRMAGHLGFVSDRGSFHYILDKQKDGVYETDRLCFCFELGGREDLAFEKDGDAGIHRDDADGAGFLNPALIFHVLHFIHNFTDQRIQIMMFVYIHIFSISFDHSFVLPFRPLPALHMRDASKNGTAKTGDSSVQALWPNLPSDDTLYMTVLFLARMGQLLGREDYVQESIRQFLVHIKYLTDRKTGLLFHGWTFLGRHHFGEALWGRGNSWYTAGLVDYLELLEGNDGVRQFLLTTLEEQVKALKACQDDSGLWHTLLDDATSYLETSATSAFAYGILKAVRMGYLDQKYEETGLKAVNGVIKQITCDGCVQGVSYGTPVFANREDYRNIPVCPMPYGQSMALMMLVEAGKHFRE